LPFGAAPCHSCATALFATGKEDAMKMARRMLTALLVLASFPALAQPLLFQGMRTGLTQRDVDLLSASINRLNNAPDIAVGAKDGWSNPSSRSRGENAVRAIFQDAGTTCHKLHHEIIVKGRQHPRAYDITWCRAPDGSWKIKS
jgi:surface antigen